MAELDEAKEFLTTLRVFFTVAVVMMVAIGGGIANSYRTEQFDIIFWLGLVIEFLLFIFIFAIIKKIKQKTREIKEL
jgi:hypothetical protein